MGRVAADDTAFAHRGESVLVAIINAFVEPELVEAATAWNRALFTALEPKATGVYANFLEDEGDERIRVAYPGDTYDRLARIKRRYDPANLFHRNQNIRPG
jgi:FAD/FMN-containing dehydrogenase